MGDYSRDPFARLTDAVAKHYVGVRLLQGVPVLDANWNELDDLHRHELAAASAWITGDGVPTGSDGFRILSLAGDGVGTVVLTADTPGSGFSTVAVDLGVSTAADALGFAAGNAEATREGSSPARLTSDRAEPFALAAGQTLTVIADGGAPETITFAAGDFAAIGAATAAEVVTALNAGLNRATASAGTGNDFLIRGRTDPFHAGCILVGGQLTHNDRDLKYSEQPLYENAVLAADWAVDAVEALVTPIAPTRLTVYLDVWLREVRFEEDDLLVDPRIGLETANRLRREWAVRVIEDLNFAAAQAARPPGHTYYPLAWIDRTANPAIAEDMITDLRDTEASVRRAVAYRGSDGAVLVGSDDLMALLTQTRDNVRDFITFLTSQFVDPGDAYVAGEVAGIDALSAIASVAEHGLALLHAETLGTRAAFDLFAQLLDAETRFVTVWRDALFPVIKPGGAVYETAFEVMVDRIETFLTGPAPAGFTTIEDALAVRNLTEAVRSQEQVNDEWGDEIGRPTGGLSVTYLGSATPVIQQNVPFVLEFEIDGSVTPDDDIDVEVFIDAAWQTTLLNEDGTQPLALRMGPGADTVRFRLSVRPPNVAAAETPVSVRVFARRNSGGLSHLTPQRTLRIGDPPPPSEEDFSFSFVADVPTVNGVFQVPVSGAAIVTFELFNNTITAQDVDLSFQPPNSGAAAPWSFVTGGFPVTNQTVPANGSREFGFMFTAPAAPGNDLVFVFQAEDSATNALLAEAQITLTSV
ncbi:MAG: hypothetical protein HKN04_14270 [Rhodothermaceae bacterium]|nr:hypothetical protein [Rhodothermaceae bacterium]